MGKKQKSVIIPDLSICYVCKRPYPEIHHIYFGSRRKISDKYGFVIPLCAEHHRGNVSPHRCREIDLTYKRMGQHYFEEHCGSREEFIKVFGRSYL